MSSSKIESVRNNYIGYFQKESKRLEEYKRKLNEAKLKNNDNLVEIYQKNVNNSLQRLRNYQSLIDFIRDPDYEDVTERRKIISEFPKIIKSVIPDNVPIVFHGNKNIGVIHEIIKTGGLLTPEQRDVSESSFATQIDVAYKNNIYVSCEFAEPGINSFMPYGAIFAFLPLEREVPKVLSTGVNSEVQGGVDGVDFRKDSSRLIGIITTKENKEKIRTWCLEYNWDEQKVFTHEEFVLKCREMFSNEQEQFKVM